MNEYVISYFDSAKKILDQLSVDSINRTIDLLVETREKGGRLFLLGVGGSAANASHAVNDFRKLTGIESYTPTDNVSELTARINDDGWDTVFQKWLETSRLDQKDTILVFSVGGGNLQKNISVNLIKALVYAKDVGASVIGIVGRDGGFTAQVSDACVMIPVVDPLSITPLTEAFQAVIWHLIVTHPKLKKIEGKWESTR